MTAGEVSTYGWDVVVASTIDAVNRALPPTGAQSVDETVTRGATSVTVTATLGDWRLVTGGSAALVNMSVACTSLSMTDGKKSVSFRDGTFEVQGCLEVRPPSNGSGNARRRLVVSAGKGAVTVLGASFDDAQFATFASYATAAVQAWLDAQPMLPVIVAAIGATCVEAHPLAAVLAPIDVSYAYTDTPAGGGVLGVLSTVAGGADSIGRLQEVSPDAVTSGDAVLIVSDSVMAGLLGGAAAVGFGGGAPPTPKAAVFSTPLPSAGGTS